MAAAALCAGFMSGGMPAVDAAAELLKTGMGIPGLRRAKETARTTTRVVIATKSDFIPAIFYLAIYRLSQHAVLLQWPTCRGSLLAQIVTYALVLFAGTLRDYLDPQGRCPFEDWFESLNAQAAAKVTTNPVLVETGHFSDVKGIGADVFEDPTHFGPEFRV